jgi:hypothetical protein
MGSSPQPPVSIVPSLFLTASILDALFQHARSRPQCVQLTSRDNALTEMYKWVAIATGSQFAVRDGDAKEIAKSH